MAQKITVWAALLLAGLLPFSTFWEIGRPIVDNVLPLYVTPVIYLTDIPILILFFASAVNFLKNPAAGPSRSKKQRIVIGLLLIGLNLTAGLSLIHSLSLSLGAWSLLRWTNAIGLFFVLTFQDFPQKLFLKVFLCSLLVQVFIGLGQIISGGPLGLPGELALNLSSPRAAVIYTASRDWLRAYGMTFHPNVLGGFLFSGLLICLPWLDRPVWRIVWLWLGIGLLLSFSRSAWLATAICVPLASIWLAKKFQSLRRSLIIMLCSLSVIGLVSAAFLAKPIFTRLAVLESRSELASMNGRGELIQLAFHLVQEYPLTGVGAGNFPLAQLSENTQEPAHYVHNVILLLFAEVGLLGGIIWAILWLLPIFYIQPQQNNQVWRIVFAIAWFGLGSIALWDSYPWALESGRLLSVMLLAFTARAFDETIL